MPNFPRYESKGELTTQQPAAFAPESTAGKIAENSANSMAAATQTAFKFEAALATIQKTTAETNFKTGLVDIINRAQNDPNANNSKQYTDEIEKLKSDNTKGLFGHHKLSGELDYQSKVGAIQLDNIYKKKAIDVGQTSILSNIATEITNPTPNSLGNIKKVLDENAAHGIISHEDAYKMYEKANEKIGVERISKDIYQSQSAGQLAIVKNSITSGAYEQGGVTVDPTKKVLLLNKATRMETYLKDTERNKTENEMAYREIDNQLTMPEVEDAFKNGLISRSFYESRKRTLESSLGDTAHTDNETYNQLTKMLVSPTTKPEDARNAILEKNAEGKLSRQDLSNLYSMHLIPTSDEHTNLQSALGETGKNDFNSMKALNDAQDKLMEDKKGWWHSAFQVFDNTLGKDTQAVADAKQKLYENVKSTGASKEGISAEANKIMNAETLRKYPQIKSFPKEGKVLGEYRYFPDGSSKEEK